MPDKIEKHPLTPFLPENAKILMLGSFPPKKDKWSMEFFYPNWINDMWRIIGTVFFNDKEYFIVPGQKKFDKEGIEAFCKEKGIALFDTASEVIRLKDNASDKFLEIVTPTDLGHILSRIPECKAIVTTGQKATDVIVETFGCAEPPVGEMSELNPHLTADTSDNDIKNKDTLHFWRMPSSSRAYPLKLENKAVFYKKMFETEGLV